MTNIRKETCIIVRKNDMYLVGRIVCSRELRWSRYRYDAFRTRDREKARRIARAVGGRMVLFNPIIGKEMYI